MQIVLPRGRMLSASINLLQKSIPGLRAPEDRELLYRNGSVEVLLAKPADVPVYVETGVDVGITGKDVVLENSHDLFIPTSLPFGRCRLSIATLKNDTVPVEQMDGYRIATEYPNLTRNYFKQIDVSVKVIKVNGATELAPRAGIADAIVDVVQTGNTLKVNGLEEVETIAQSTALLLVNRISQKTKFDQVNELIFDIRELIKRESQ